MTFYSIYITHYETYFLAQSVDGTSDTCLCRSLFSQETIRRKCDRGVVFALGTTGYLYQMCSVSFLYRAFAIFETLVRLGTNSEYLELGMCHHFMMSKTRYYTELWRNKLNTIIFIIWLNILLMYIYIYNSQVFRYNISNFSIHTITPLRYECSG